MDATLLQAFVYLAAAAIAVPAAQRLGLGSVLGYLVAGAVVGPFALDLVGDTAEVGHVAEFGVVILLFLIGLEVRPALLWRLRTLILGLGAGQLGATGLALAAAALLLGLPWPEAVAAGFILAMSSTAIVLQLLDEKGLRRGAVGRAAFGVLLLQDLAVIPLLALLPLAAARAVPEAAGAVEAGGALAALPGWARVAAVPAAIALVVVGGRYLTRPLFRAIARARLREAFTASALLLVVGVALLMETVGLSPALGAFLAGVVLADSEFVREIETDIEPFRGLLLGVFFITVGAGLDLALVAARPALLLGLVAGLMALKGLAMFCVARAFRMAGRDAGLLAAALSQGGEFAFVLLSFAAAAGVLAGEVASLLTAAVALSMAATPVALVVADRVLRAAPRAEVLPENAFEEAEPAAIIAGFGRFGQIVGRVLNANGFETAVLESSVEQIGLLRRFGRRVYYGDAARLDLLRAAGAERARLLVVAIDDREKAAETVASAREAFPHLTILARAFDRRHAYELLDRGADEVERETFEAGLSMAAQALRALGWRAYPAERAARLFRRHDERMFDALRSVWRDEERFVVATRESSPRMEELLRSDLGRLGPSATGPGWAAEPGWDAAPDEAPEAAAGTAPQG